MIFLSANYFPCKGLFSSTPSRTRAFIVFLIFFFFFNKVCMLFVCYLTVVLCVVIKLTTVYIRRYYAKFGCCFLCCFLCWFLDFFEHPPRAHARFLVFLIFFIFFFNKVYWLFAGYLLVDLMFMIMILRRCYAEFCRLLCGWYVVAFSRWGVVFNCCVNFAWHLHFTCTICPVLTEFFVKFPKNKNTSWQIHSQML